MRTGARQALATTAALAASLGLALAMPAGACNKRERAAPRESWAGLDLAEASQRVRALAVDCAGLTRALDQLAASGISGRALSGLVDDALAAGQARCAAPAEAAAGEGAPHRLARSALLEEQAAAALAALGPAPAAGDGTVDPALRFRRAELLDRLGRPREALAELDAAIARAPDEAALAQRRMLAVADAVRAGRPADAAAAIAAAPLTERPSLAYRAAADARADALDALAAAATEAELAAAIAERIERERGSAAAVAARARAAAAAPDRAEHLDAHARALAAAGQLDAALAAWDRAAALAPAQPAYQLAPIRAAMLARDPARARARAAALAEVARAAADPDPALTAAAAAAATGDTTRAVELARLALRRNPGDGRLAFAVAERLAEAGDRAAAAAAYMELLVCGARGRPWHRHEVAGRLVALATDPPSTRLVTAALYKPPACPAPDPPDLASYVDAARGKLAGPASDRYPPADARGPRSGTGF